MSLRFHSTSPLSQVVQQVSGTAGLPCFVQPPLTSLGFKTFCHLCKHCTSVRPWKYRRCCSGGPVHTPVERLLYTTACCNSCCHHTASYEIFAINPTCTGVTAVRCSRSSRLPLLARGIDKPESGAHQLFSSSCHHDVPRPFSVFHLPAKQNTIQFCGLSRGSFGAARHHSVPQLSSCYLICVWVLLKACNVGIATQFEKEDGLTVALAKPVSSSHDKDQMNAYPSTGGSRCRASSICAARLELHWLLLRLWLAIALTSS